MIVLLNDYLNLDNQKFSNLIYYNLADESGIMIESCEIESHILSRLSRRVLRLENLKYYRWCIDCLRESHDSHYCNIIYRALIEIGVPSENILFLVAVDDTKEHFQGNVIFCHSWHAKWYHHYVQQLTTTEMSKIFVCLMRRPNNPRKFLAQEILSRDWDNKNYTLSLGTDSKYDFSLFVDSLTTVEKVHNITPMLKTLINVIAETSSDQDIHNDNSFLTEKTFKCFSIGQIPIWFGHPGLHRTAKSLGYDIFEDIIDHEKISNQKDWHSKSKVLCDQLDKFMKMDSLQLTNFHQQIAERLHKNQTLTKFYCESNKNNLEIKIKRWHDLGKLIL
jgi:hypothetical protein